MTTRNSYCQDLVLFLDSFLTYLKYTSERNSYNFCMLFSKLNLTFGFSFRSVFSLFIFSRLQFRILYLVHLYIYL